MTPKPKRPGLKFNAATHRYWLDGKPVPGVTTILGVLDKPAIPKWAAGQVAEYVADNPDGVETLRGMGRGPMVQALKGIPWQKRDDAGVRGNVLHDYAEQILNGQEVEVDEEHVPVMESALAFMDHWHIKPLLVEAWTMPEPLLPVAIRGRLGTAVDRLISATGPRRRTAGKPETLPSSSAR